MRARAVGSHDETGDKENRQNELESGNKEDYYAADVKVIILFNYCLNSTNYFSP